MHTLFLSDVHLTPETPALATALLGLLTSPVAMEAERIYLLGDLFEAWLGDDGAPAELDPLVQTLLALNQQGKALFFQHGNRDFLVGEQFAARCGMSLLEESTVIDLYGEKTLIMHGDSLCSDDLEYQQFRQMVRNPDWQRQFLALPVEARLAQAREARAKSRESTSNKAEDIMDVNQQAVETAMREAGVSQLIHGHTHRPAIHPFTLDGQAARRTVLGDWQQGEVSYLVVDPSGYHLHDPRCTQHV